MWKCAGTGDQEGREEVRGVNVIEDPWRQPARKRWIGNTRDIRKNEEGESVSRIVCASFYVTMRP